MKLIVKVNGKSYDVEVEILEDQEGAYTPEPAIETVKTPTVIKSDVKNALSSPEPRSVSANSQLLSPIPGVIIKVLAQSGSSFKKGETLVIIEAMKMETELKCPYDAIVKTVHVSQGASVMEGQCLVEFE